MPFIKVTKTILRIKDSLETHLNKLPELLKP